MAISQVGAATGTTSCTVPAHNIGDLIVIFAYRSGSTTAPSLGAGFVSILTKAGTSCSARIGFKIATATNDASGTWTNATQLTCIVYTSSNRTTGGSLYVGGSASNSSINTTINYPALTMTHADGTSWAAGFAGTSVATAALSTHPPTGMTFFSGSDVTATVEVCAFDTAGAVSSWSSQNTTVGASGNSVSATLEIIENLPGAGIPSNIVQSVYTAANAVISTAAGNNFRIPLPNPTLAGNGLVLAVSYPTANTPAITDDGGNTWPASGAAGTVTADAGDQVLQMFRLASAATGTKVITVNFGSTVVQPVKIWIWEVTGITGTVNGTVEAAGVNSLGIVSPGSFTPTNNDANGGNLIFAVTCIANGTSSVNPNLFVPESGYTLTNGDILWTGTQGNPSASQVFLQATAAATTPRFYVTASGTQTYNVVAMALSVGVQGTPKPAGIHIDAIHYMSAAGNTASMRMQVPSSGNLAVFTGFMSSATSTNPTWTAIVDSDGTSYTRIDPSPAATPCFYYNPNQTPKSYRTATITLGNGTGNPVQVVYYDISGAATSPFDTSAGQSFATLNGSNQASASAIITPSTQNCLVLGFLQLGLGPSTTLASPSGGFADLPTYDTATGTGSITTTTLTISATTWGTFGGANNLVAGPNITAGTSIVSGTSPTFTINPSQTAASGAVTQKQFDSDTMSFGNFAGHYYNGSDVSAETWTINITNQGTAAGGNFTVAAFKAAPTGGFVAPPELGGPKFARLGITRGPFSLKFFPNSQAFPPAAGTVSLGGFAVTQAKSFGLITGTVPLLGSAKTMAELRAQMGSAAALAAKATAQAKASGAMSGAAAMAGRSTTMAKAMAGPSGVVPLAGAAATQAKALGAIIFATFLSGRVTTLAKATASIAGSAALSARATTQAKAASLASGVVPLAGQVATQAKAAGSIIFATFLSGRVTTMAKAAAAATGSAALAARATTVATARAGFSGTVGLSGAITTAAKAFGTLGTGGLVALSGMVTTMAKAAGRQAAAVTLAGYLTAQTKALAASPVAPPAGQFQYITSLGGIFNPGSNSIG